VQCPKFDLVLEAVRKILAAVVHPQSAFAVGTSAFQLSTAVKSRHQPPSRVKLFVPSAPHMTFGAAPVERRSLSVAPGLKSFFIDCLLEQEICIISASKRTWAAIN
jgi:hypothetical protein